MKRKKDFRYEVFHDLVLPLHCMYIIDRVISCILNICLIKIAIIAYPPMVYSTDILGQFFGTLPLSRHYKGEFAIFSKSHGASGQWELPDSVK